MVRITKVYGKSLEKLRVEMEVNGFLYPVGKGDELCIVVLTYCRPC